MTPANIFPLSDGLSATYPVTKSTGLLTHKTLPLLTTKPVQRVVCGDSTHQLNLITKSLIFFPAALTIVRALSLAQKVTIMKLVIASVISLLSFSALAAPEGTLSVHILNQQTGLPSPGVQIELDKQQGESWQHIATGKTDADGRIKSLYPQAENMEPGVYKVTFKTGDYFKSQNMNTFFPVIPVIFNVTKQNQKLHIPLLLSQYGYSTYRGS